MTQIFHPSANTISRVSIFGAVFFLGGLLYLGYTLVRSPYQAAQGVTRDQPIQFMHNHHVDQLGIDCRYCHTNVETAASPGMPPTETCMSCHSQVWTQSPLLEPVRASWRDGKPIKWNKVHDIPDFVYFHHGVHVQKGVSCTTCHGNVADMAMVYKAQPMTMQWCLECHRNPTPNLGPPELVFALTAKPDPNRKPPVDWKLPADADKYKDPHASGMTNCSTCHR